MLHWPSYRICVTREPRPYGDIHPGCPLWKWAGAVSSAEIYISIKSTMQEHFSTAQYIHLLIIINSCDKYSGISMEEPMPLSAICTSPCCGFQIKLQDYEAGTSISTPQECPQCGQPVISLCPHCGFLLLGKLNMENPTCALCGRGLRGASREASLASDGAR